MKLFENKHSLLKIFMLGIFCFLPFQKSHAYVDVTICSSADVISSGSPVTINWHSSDTSYGDCSVSSNLEPVARVLVSGTYSDFFGNASCSNGATPACNTSKEGSTCTCPNLWLSATSDSKTVHPTTTTTYSVSCTKSTATLWGLIKTSDTQSASITVYIDNGCAANTCVNAPGGCFNGYTNVPGTKNCDYYCASTTCTDKQCDNGPGLVWGTMPIAYDNQNCTYNDSFDCSLAANCGKTNSHVASCAARRTCNDGNGLKQYDYGLNPSICGPSCTSSSIQCPGCQLQIPHGGFIETSPF